MLLTKLLFLENGQVIERGTHAIKLLAAIDWYAEIVG